MSDEAAARLSPTPDEARRHLNRLADRLRVMGPRLAGRSSVAAEATLAAVRAGLQGLADLAAAEYGTPAHVVPALDVHALADQALVLGNDLLEPAGRLRPAAPPADLFRARVTDALDAVYTLL